MFDIKITFRHFPLHPDTPEEGLTLEQLFAGRPINLESAKRKMAKLMRQEGLAYGDRSMTYNSRLAQELASWADAQQADSGIHNALFRAYYVDNLNLALVDNLVPIAAGVGLDADAARNALTTREARSAIDADWQRCRELGITGVPTFLCGNRMTVGAQPFEVLQQLVVAAGASPSS